MNVYFHVIFTLCLELNVCGTERYESCEALFIWYLINTVCLYAYEMMVSAIHLALFFLIPFRHCIVVLIL